MNRFRRIAMSVGLATLFVVGLACGGGNDGPPTSTDSAAQQALNDSETSLALAVANDSGTGVAPAASTDGEPSVAPTAATGGEPSVAPAAATDSEPNLAPGVTPEPANDGGTRAAPEPTLTYEEWCLRFTPGAECSPLLSLTDQDTSELIRQTLERALVDNDMIAAGVSLKDNGSIVLSTENINGSLVPDIPNRKLVLLGPEEIQKKADDQGDFMYLSFNRIEVRGSIVQAVLAHTLAQGKDSEKTEGFHAGGFLTVEYKQISGEWVGVAQALAIP